MNQGAAAITRRLQLVFIVSMLLLLISSASAYFSLRRLINNAEAVNHTNQVLQESEKIISKAKDAETGQRGYLLTHNQEFLKPYNGAFDEVKKSVETVRELTVDNALQQKNMGEINLLVNQRFERLQKTIANETAKNIAPHSGTHLSEEDYAENEARMLQGKKIMDDLRMSINGVQDEEKRVLAIRTKELNNSTRIAPFIVVVAAILSLLITLLAYVRIKSDLEERIQKQKEEAFKYAQTAERLAVLETVTKDIASGNYAARSLEIKREDDLGNIAFALNEMAGSLEKSFHELDETNWIKTGVVKISDATRGQRYLKPLAEELLRAISEYTYVLVSTLYIKTGGDDFKLAGKYAVSRAPEYLNESNSLLGEALKQKELKIVRNLPADYLNITSSIGNAVTNSLVIVPLVHDDEVIGGIELGLLNEPMPRLSRLLEQLREPLAVTIDSALNYEKLEDLFERTQSQAEELKTQHSELENLNAELEAQAQKLQASEEELRVQQEELMQTNSELEERSKLLEEKNDLITERNLVIQQKAEELELSTRYKSEFLANMSHELRTPLNSILLLSRLLSENGTGNMTPDQMEYAEVIQNSGNGLLNLIDEILDLSKIEAGKMDVSFEKVSLQHVAENLKSLFAPLASEKKIELNISLEKNLPQAIETDRMRLDQVLKNLLSNAFKFTSEGSVSLKIKASEKEKNNVLLIVEDTGIGIAKDKQSVIFEAFQQADGSTRRRFGGTGLGLSISRELVRLLGGSMQLQSEEGKGSVFTVSLPVSGREMETQESSFSKNDKSVEDASPSKNMSSELLPIPETIPDDRSKIKQADKVLLVVEDDVAFAKALLDFIRTKGYKGIVACRGDEGILLAEKYQPAGVLLDIQLPVKNGWEVMHALKENKATRHIPVHMMSSLEARKESIYNGAIDFISKPIAFEQMQVVLKRLEAVRSKESKKVLIVEENAKHATALAYFLETINVSSEVLNNVKDSVIALQKDDVDCVILDMGIPGRIAYDTLEAIKKEPNMENLPIIVFTGKSLSESEEQKLRRYADSIVVKTAHSYQRILDEVSLFLHLVAEEKTETAKPKKHSAMTDVLRNKSILIADDDVRNVFSLSKALEQHGMKVLTAINGKEALVIVKNQKADVVLMDIMMPQMDGYDAIRNIRRDPAFVSLPIIAVTAKTMVGDREKCMDAGASDYISKPVDIDQLLSLLRVWLYQPGNA